MKAVEASQTEQYAPGLVNDKYIKWAMPTHTHYIIMRIAVSCSLNSVSGKQPYFRFVFSWYYNILFLLYYSTRYWNYEMFLPKLSDCNGIFVPKQYNCYEVFVLKLYLNWALLLPVVVSLFVVMFCFNCSGVSIIHSFLCATSLRVI